MQLDYIHDNGERLTDLGLLDAMGEMKSRCFGLSAAVRGGGLGDRNEQEGVCWLADDVAYGMARLIDAFEAERLLRDADGHA